MIQIANLTEITASDIPNLVKKIEPELKKRKRLYQQIKRKVKNSELIFDIKNIDGNTQIPLERAISLVATGYFAGKEPKYVVEEQLDKKRKKILEKILGRAFNNKNYAAEMEILIDYITKFNDDSTEHWLLAWDYITKTACYERQYENSDNEYVYARLDALQTVGIYDYSLPVNLIGSVRIWHETDVEGNKIKVVEITDITGIRVFSTDIKKKDKEHYTELTERREEYDWEDVPIIAMEDPDGVALHEPAVGLIRQLEQVFQNEANTHEYNDDAILQVVGYSPQNPATIIDEETGKEVINPARVLEDKYNRESGVWYFPSNEHGAGLEWVEKNVDDNAKLNFKKASMDLITLVTSVPNFTDLGFTNAENASALDRKFFQLEQFITNMVNQFKMGYLRRWELIFGRINQKKGKDYNWRDIKVKLYRNLPTDKQTETENALKLKGLVSDETVINELPYEFNALVELQKKAEQDEIDLENNMRKMELFKKQSDNQNNIEKEEEEL